MYIILINQQELPNGWEFKKQEEAEQYAGYLQSQGYAAEVKAISYE